MESNLSPLFPEPLIPHKVPAGLVWPGRNSKDTYQDGSWRGCTNEGIHPNIIDEKGLTFTKHNIIDI